MRFVVVQHDERVGKYLFSVPQSHYLYFGDHVLVKTRNGVQTGVCACDSFAVEDRDVENVCKMYGTQPSKMMPVIGTVCFQYWETEGEQNGVS